MRGLLESLRGVTYRGFEWVKLVSTVAPEPRRIDSHVDPVWGGAGIGTKLRLGANRPCYALPSGVGVGWRCSAFAFQAR